MRDRRQDCCSERERSSAMNVEFSEINRKIDNLEAQLRENPNDRILKAKLSAILAGHGREYEALALARTLVAENEQDAWAWEQLAKYYDACDMIEESKAAYYKAIELDAGWADPWVNLGNLLANNGEPEQALRCYHKAAELEPDAASIKYNIRIVQRELKQRGVCK